MNSLRKALLFLIAFGFMLPLKAEAESWSYGVKVGFATSFARCNDQQKELFNLVHIMKSLLLESLLLEQSQLGRFQLEQMDPVAQFQKLKLTARREGLDLDEDLELDSRIWNPSFGAALYMEYAINDHIGLGAELLYNRFEQLLDMKASEKGYQLLQQSAQFQGISSNEIKIQTSFDTIGLPMLLTWYWTAAIRPDFKDDYFLGRLFVGIHPFYLVARTASILFHLNGKAHIRDITPPKDDQKKFQKDEQRFKMGFIGGTSLELPSAFLLEIKAMLPYNLMSIEDKEFRPNVASFHLSFGYNFAKFV